MARISHCVRKGSDLSYRWRIEIIGAPLNGFLGIERSAVRSIARRVGEILQDLKSTFPGNLKPKAFNAKLATSTDTPLTINLDSLSYDPDGDPLRFTLPHDSSSRGGALQLRGSWLRYWPPRGATRMVDGLVFRVTDGKGGVSTGVIRVPVNESQGEW